MSTGSFPSMLGITVRCSPAPVMALICDCSSSTPSTSTGDRESSSMPGTDRVALPVTVCGHDTVPAMLRATAHPTSRILADAGMTETNRFAASSNTVGRVSVFAAATGIGSWPGSSPREAAEIVIGELHTLPHLVELPARGVGADMIGRAGALLVDIGIDTVPRGYRIAAGRSAVVRRAASLLDEDIDALEEAWEKAGLRGGT